MDSHISKIHYSVITPIRVERFTPLGRLNNVVSLSRHSSKTPSLWLRRIGRFRSTRFGLSPNECVPERFLSGGKKFKGNEIYNA